MTKYIISFLIGSLFTLCSAETLLYDQQTVHYETKPSGRVYGSDGTVKDQYPTGKVYDMQGKPYANSMPAIGRGDTLAKPLPRATINPTNGMINKPHRR